MNRTGRVAVDRYWVGITSVGFMFHFFRERYARRAAQSRHAGDFTVSSLESRQLLSALPVSVVDKPQKVSTAALHPLTDIPVLNSNPSAFAKLYLDFDGDPPSNWSGSSVPVTPAYDQDNNVDTFSDGELNSIKQIWQRVSEKYSPFKINVTTVLPSNFNDKHAQKIVIGGDGAWLGSPAGGVSQVGSFFNSQPNVSYVFPDELSNGNAKFVAEATAHEAGHSFGLTHQSTYNGTTKVDEYNPGDSKKAPIMGDSYNATRGLWWKGQSSNSSTSQQDDLAILSGSSDGFGYRVDDHGSTQATANPLTINGTSVSAAGIIERMTDADVFSFQTGSGQISLVGHVATIGPTLDLKLELRDASYNVVATASSTNLAESISANVAAGTYYLVVLSQGNYGDLGQYTVTGTISDLPVANAGGPYTVDEGSAVVLSATGSTGSGVSYLWDLDGDGVFGETGLTAIHGDEIGSSPLYSAVGLDGPSSQIVQLQVIDAQNQMSTASATINIVNVDPIVAPPTDQTIGIGSLLTVVGSFNDPGGDTWVGTVNWGDGTSDEPFILNPDKSFSLERTFLNPGLYVATATVSDGISSSSGTFQVTVRDGNLIGGSGDDTWYVSFASPNGDVQFYENTGLNGPPSFSIPMSSLTNITIDGGPGSDRLVVIGTDANDSFILAGANLSFDGIGIGHSNLESFEIDGGAGDDSLTISQPSALNPLFNGGSGYDTLDLRAGAYHFAADAALTSDHLKVLASGIAHVYFDSLQHLQELKLNNSAKAYLAPGGTIVLRTQHLSVGSNAKLDLADNALVLQSDVADQADDLAKLTDLVGHGRAGGNWSGSGIVSSVAASEPNGITGLAIVANHKSNGSPLMATIGGEPADAQTIIVKYTYNGDVDMNGHVDADDYFAIDLGFIGGLAGYANGDLEFSGKIDSDDYFLIDRAFAGQGSPLAASPPVAKVAAVQNHHHRSPTPRKHRTKAQS